MVRSIVAVGTKKRKGEKKGGGEKCGLSRKEDTAEHMKAQQGSDAVYDALSIMIPVWLAIVCVQLNSWYQSSTFS